jgi:hypothetical protein
LSSNLKGARRVAAGVQPSSRNAGETKRRLSWPNIPG